IAPDGCNGGRCAHATAPSHQFRMPAGKSHRVVAALRVADDGHAPPAEGVHHTDEVAREVFGGVRRRLGPLALAVAALIERDHVEPLGERGLTRSNQCACAEPPCRKQRAGRPGPPHSRRCNRRPLMRSARARAVSHPKRGGTTEVYPQKFFLARVDRGASVEERPCSTSRLRPRHDDTSSTAATRCCCWRSRSSPAISSWRPPTCARYPWRGPCPNPVRAWYQID